MKFDVIYIDVPWMYKGNIKWTLNSGDHYNRISFKKLLGFNFDEIAGKNSIMFMWTTSPILKDSISLMENWGFRYRTVGFVWHKQLPVMGVYTMSECEYCIVGVKGNISKILKYKKVGRKSVKQFISERRTTHSVKPDEVRNRIDVLFPKAKKLEMFARKKAKGWYAFGNEIKNGFKIKFFEECL